jgi:hypothetical protein
VISILAHDLHRMLTQVAPHISRDDTLPVITAVHLEARDGFLFASATDRFTMAIARQPILNTDEWKVIIPGVHLAGLNAWLKACHDITLTYSSDDKPQLTLADGTNSITIATLDSSHTLPDWRRLIRKYLDMDVEPVPLSGVTSKYLARWKDAAQILHVWQPSASAPLIFMDERSEFIGMQMPVRTDKAGRDELVDGWRKCLTRYATVGEQRFNLDAEMFDSDGDPWEYSGKDRYGEPLVHLVGIDDDPFTLKHAVTTFGLRGNA